MNKVYIQLANYKYGAIITPQRPSKYQISELSTNLTSNQAYSRDKY